MIAGFDRPDSRSDLLDNASAFEWAHLYVWQTLIMVDVLVVWLLWLRWIRTADAPLAPA